MKLQIFALLFICFICIASGVQQLGQPAGKVLALGSLAAKNITNLTNISNQINITGNFSNQTQQNLSGLKTTLFQGNESVMETPSEASAQSDLSKRDLSSLGQDSGKHSSN